MKKSLFKITRIALLVVCLLMVTSCMLSCHLFNGNNDDNNEDKYENLVKLTIDAGGQNAQYNTTSSLEYDKFLNPYPYNTLETLVNAWNDANAEKYGYYFVVADNSINMDRETMAPMLSNGSAPEILYYLGTTIAEDQSKGWFYDISSDMETPNKYSKAGELGSAKWKDIYDSASYASTFAPNGEKYTVELEQNPIGIIYNKTLFEAAGITETPVTYKDFMEAQDKINAYAQTINRGNPADDSTYICPYFHMYPWYDSYLESTLWASELEYMDVITVDGRVDAEEYARAYMQKDPVTEERRFSPEDEKYVELFRLIKQMTKYYPTNYSSYYAEQQFLVGNLAMLEVVGGSIREIVDTVDGEFEIGVMPYPVLTQQPENEEANPYYTTCNVDKYVRRGFSGYSTGWAITNSAMNKDNAAGNTNCVDACVDILMYLSCFENNDKMVNDLGFAVPLSGNTTNEYFKSLANTYKGDVANENTVSWSCATAGGTMNKDYYDAFYLFRQDAIGLSLSEVESKLSVLKSSFTNSVNTLYNVNKWDNKAWPAYGVSNQEGK
ncbi:MAG: carbohydrate ABC transporter substrate-binding protein [Clostridia bacterium]|nr:carbohydrate ABC transporter substrate-binding protein [Clostridia bacterium]